MLALVFLRINQQTKFEVPSFTISKDMIWAKFKKSHRPRPFGGGLSSLSLDMIKSTVVQILKTSVSSSRDIIGSPKI